MSFSSAIAQPLPALLIVLGLGAVVTYCNVFPRDKLGDLVQLCYSIILPLSLIYTAGWMEQTRDDYIFLFSALSSQALVLVLALSLAVAMEMTKPKDSRNFASACLLTGSCVLSSATKHTSWNLGGVQKQVFLYDLTTYLMIFTVEFLDAKVKQNEIKMSTVSRASFDAHGEQLLIAHKEVTLEPAIVVGDAEDILTGDSLAVIPAVQPVLQAEQPQNTKKDVKRNGWLQVFSMLGLCVLGIPLAQGVKAKPLPYCVSQTFNYLNLSSVSIMLFCTGIAFYRQDLRQFFSHWQQCLRVTCLAVLMQICKQIIQPLLTKAIYNCFGADTSLSMPVVAAPTGFLWMYFAADDGAWISIIGLAMMPALQWIVQ